MPGVAWSSFIDVRVDRSPDSAGCRSVSSSFCSSAPCSPSETRVRKPVSSAERDRDDAGQHGDAERRAGSIRRRRASASSPRTRGRRPAAPGPATSRRPLHRPAAAARCRRSRPASAAPVRIRPRIGPGARRPQQAGARCRAGTTDRRRPRAPRLSATLDSRAPAPTNGRIRRSATARESSSVRPNSASSDERDASGRTGWPARPSRRRPRRASRRRAKVDRHAEQHRQPARTNG